MYQLHAITCHYYIMIHNVHIITHTYIYIDLITCIILLLPFSAALDKMLVLKSNAGKTSLRNPSNIFPIFRAWRTSAITLLRVIPTMAFQSITYAISYDILLSGICIWHIFWHSFWHSIWYIFGNSLWLRNTLIRSARLRSGGEHFDLELAVESLQLRSCGGRRGRRRASWHKI